MSAIMISQVAVTDQKIFQDYMTKTQEVAKPYGAELLFRGRRGDTLNGESNSHHMTVIVRFPDMETIHRWYQSPEYQAIIPLREQSSHQVMVTYQET